MRVAHINGNIRCFAIALYFQFLNLKLYGKIHRAIYYQRVIFSWSLIFLLFIYLFTLSEIRPVSFLHINKVPRWTIKREKHLLMRIWRSWSMVTWFFHLILMWGTLSFRSACQRKAAFLMVIKTQTRNRDSISAQHSSQCPVSYYLCVGFCS